MKEIIRKKRGICDSFPKRLIINNGEITNTRTMAELFSHVFVKIGPNRAPKIRKTDTNFEPYISKVKTKLYENLLLEDEFFQVFKLFKVNTC